MEQTKTLTLEEQPITNLTIDKVKLFSPELLWNIFPLKAQPTISNLMKNKLLELAIDLYYSILNKEKSILQAKKEVEEKFSYYIKEYKGKGEIFHIFFNNIYALIKKQMKKKFVLKKIGFF